MLPDAPLNIVIAAGQSNMLGRRTWIESISPHLRDASPNCLYWSSEGWVPLQPGKLDQKTAFGPEITLARSFADVDDAPVGIVKLAKLASSLEKDWSPNLRRGLFARLIQQVQASLLDRSARLCGFAWLQGETECLNEDDALLYEKRFKEFVASLRASLSVPNLPVVAGIVNPPADVFQFRDTVRKALMEAEIKNYSTVQIDDLGLQRDRLHLSGPGLEAVGLRFADELRKFEKPKFVRHMLLNSPNYQCWYEGPEEIPDHVIVSFPFAAMKSGFGDFGFGQRVFNDAGTAAVYIRSNSSHWFQHDEIFPLAEKIRQYVGSEKELTLYGASMGAYGAFLLSGVLKPKRIFAIAPQFSIDRSVVPWETRWSKWAKRIDRFRYDLRDHIDADAKKFVFFDNMSMDRKHVELLPIDDNWKLIKTPYASHQVLRYLHETGGLSDLLSNIQGDEKKPGQHFFSE